MNDVCFLLDPGAYVKFWYSIAKLGLFVLIWRHKTLKSKQRSICAFIMRLPVINRMRLLEFYKFLNITNIILTIIVCSLCSPYLVEH